MRTVNHEHRLAYRDCLTTAGAWTGLAVDGLIAEEAAVELHGINSTVIDDPGFMLTDVALISGTKLI